MVEEMNRNGGKFMDNMKLDQDDAYSGGVDCSLSAFIETRHCRHL